MTAWELAEALRALGPAAYPGEVRVRRFETVPDDPDPVLVESVVAGVRVEGPVVYLEMRVEAVGG